MRVMICEYLERKILGCTDVRDVLMSLPWKPHPQGRLSSREKFLSNCKADVIMK